MFAKALENPYPFIDYVDVEVGTKLLRGLLYPFQGVTCTREQGGRELGIQIRAFAANLLRKCLNRLYRLFACVCAMDGEGVLGSQRAALDIIHRYRYESYVTLSVCDSAVLLSYSNILRAGAGWWLVGPVHFCGLLTEDALHSVRTGPYYSHDLLNGVFLPCPVCCRAEDVSHDP